MKILLALAVGTVAVLSVPASAQQVLFHDGFESGTSNWSMSGLWNLEASTDPCGGIMAPFAEGTQAAWYGLESSCDYNTPSFANAGTLAMTGWVALPANVGSVSLRFWSWSDTEYCWGDAWGQWDVHTVTVEAQGGPNSGFSQDLCPPLGPTQLLLPWHERRVDLSAYRGAQVRVSFGFGTFDDQLNSGHGWLVDDVSIVAEPGVHLCPSSGIPSSCPCTLSVIPVAGGCRNSTNQSATLVSVGVPSLAGDTLTFTASNMPNGSQATLFQATSPLNGSLFGDGIRCVSGSQVRLGTRAAIQGSTSWPAPTQAPLSTMGFVPSGGGLRYYQVIYRDSATFCNADTFNLTDSQSVLWMP